MKSLAIWMLFLLGAAGICAGDLRADLFAMTPDAAPTAMMTPRALAAGAALNRCYVLDTGLGRVLSLTPDGQYINTWPLAKLEVVLAAPLPTDPLLPSPALAVTDNTACLLNLDRVKHQLSVAVIEGNDHSRTITIPERAVNGAVALDNDGHALIAYLRVVGGKLELVLAGETADGGMDALGTLADPCDGMLKNLVFTGMATAADGRVAIGIAQSGNAAATYVRSWLIQGTLHGNAFGKALQTTHHLTLFDARGRVLERYRPLVEFAGHPGFPARPCVPLFTALALGPDGLLLSGGHSVDPFLRVYDRTDTLLRTLPRQSVGGQHIAVLPGKEGPRLYALDTLGGRVEELSPDGRVLGGFGRPVAYDISQPVSLAADRKSLYAVSRVSYAYQLARFAPDGRFLWAQTLQPPRGMEKATPFLTAPAADRVLIGWRQPQATGLGWVDTVMEDGLSAMPFWSNPISVVGAPPAVPCPTPLLTGENGRVYLLQEAKSGVRLQAVSMTGIFLQSFPVGIQGVTAVDTAGNLAWAQADEQGLIINRCTPQGDSRGWKRIPRPAQGATLLPAYAGGLWGWLSSTRSLLRFDDTMTVTDEAVVIDPDGKRVEKALAIAGDHTDRIYLAQPGRILVIKAMEQK